MSINIGRNLVAITGRPNGLKTPNTCWFPEVEQIEGREFIKIVSWMPAFSAFVKGDKRMYQAMCIARNEATTRAFQQHAGQDEDNPDALHVVRRGRKRQIVEVINQVIPASVKSEDGVDHTFMVVPEHRVDAVLRMELTHENVKLLTLKPLIDEEAVVFNPDIEENNVKWVGCRSMVACRYYDKSKTKWRTKSFTVTPSSNVAEYRERINRMAQACQGFFDLHHSEPSADESSTDDEAGGEHEPEAIMNSEGGA